MKNNEDTSSVSQLHDESEMTVVMMAGSQVLNNVLPESGFVRLSKILGNSKKGIPPIIPVSKSTWWAGIKTGRYPQPIKLSERCTCWRVEDIRALITQVGRS